MTEGHFVAVVMKVNQGELPVTLGFSHTDIAIRPSEDIAFKGVVTFLYNQGIRADSDDLLLVKLPVDPVHQYAEQQQFKACKRQYYPNSRHPPSGSDNRHRNGQK